MIGLLSVIGFVVGNALVAPLIARLKDKQSLREWWRS